MHFSTQESSKNPEALDLVAKLKKLKLLREQAFVAGQWVSDNETNVPIEVTNPATQEYIGSVPDLEKKYSERALEQAKAAFLKWRELKAKERGEYLLKWAKLINANKVHLANLMTLEQGKPLHEAMGEIDYATSFIDWFAAEGQRAYGETIPNHIDNSLMWTTREPIGVCAAITPWNFPCAMITRKVSAALAAGCTIVVRPSELTPFSALALAELADRASFPEGIFSVITGMPEAFTETVMESQDVRLVSFTGSTKVGKYLYGKSSKTLKRVSMELGGHAPFIVLPGADINRAAKNAVLAKFQTSGQDCLAVNRIYVSTNDYEEFSRKFVDYAEKLIVGNGFEPDVDIGPLINKAAIEKCWGQIVDAVDKGADLLLGEKQKPSGPFLAPTVLGKVPVTAQIFSEETFGPVAAITTYDDLDEVLESANGTPYGLAAYVFGNDTSILMNVVRRLEFGMIGINSIQFTGAPIPFGGMKQSGLGREGSRHGLNEFTELKYYCMAIRPFEEEVKR